jgi:hypothetical protein
MRGWFYLAFFLLGACGSEETICDSLCSELVQSCDYAAYPDLESCRQGCTYDNERGADTVGFQECVLAAECDTFEILECEHDYGATD